MLNREKKVEARTSSDFVLIMGGLGFIGSHLTRKLLASGYRIRIFDKLYGSHDLVSDLADRVEILEGDIEKPEDAVNALEDIDIVIDLIHTTVPGSSMLNPVYDIQSNIASHVHWLKHLADTEVKKVIYVSSGGTVYGIPREIPITETHPTNPLSSYGITKLCIEKYVAMYSELYGIRHLICRPSNVYGEGQRLNIGQGVIGVFLDRAMRCQPIEIWGNGESKRDYLYVSDLVEAIATLLSYSGKEKVFNVSTGKGYSVNDIVRVIEENTTLDVHVHREPVRGFDVPENVLDNLLLSEQTGWKPGVDLQEGIRRVYGWMKK
ncbi:MAG: NAD-dependent epimerase/dehydratase family protein [Deltaproteobacteria bacterium]|nr:NAD-dependent epimerase/dehydratase family protein [Deltaproteobacteria bacterium]